MRVGIYARVSTSEGDQNPETQLIPLREFVQAQGWTVAGEYVDQASATDLRGRAQWRALLDAAAKRGVDLVVVWKLDRAFRSVLDASTTLQNLRRWGVGLRSYTEPMIDTASGSPWGDLLFNLLAVFGEFERALIKERVRAGMSRARREGKTLGRPRKINGEWAQIQPLLASGQLSQGEAAQRLGVSQATISRWYAKGVVLPSRAETVHTNRLRSTK
jgi:DNA invertase Pin-like site-specific DNA recombinase